MSDAVKIAVIVTIGPTIISLVGLWLSYLNGQKIEIIHKATNSLKDELVAVTRKEAHAAGVKEEQDKNH